MTAQGDQHRTMQTAIEDDVSIDEIYYGSKRIFLHRAAGFTHGFKAGHFRLGTSAGDIATTIRNMTPHSVSDSTDEIPVAVPGVPALDFIVNEDKDIIDTRTIVPEFLRTPLIKGPENQVNNLDCLAVASGIRSGLVKYEQTWYRLKGCGNNSDGFIIQTTTLPKSSASGGVSWRQIRGCAFSNTVFRELNMTDRLIRALNPRGIVSANIPVGYMLYGPEFCPFGPEIQTSCVVEETRGDRRFGTHVLAGLELLLPQLLDEARLDHTDLMAAFPTTRPRHGGGVELEDIVDTDAFITDYALCTGQTGGDRAGGAKGFSWPDSPRDGSSLANMTAAERALPEVAPSANEFPQQWTCDGPVPMSPRWRATWAATVDELRLALDAVRQSSPPSSIPKSNQGPTSTALAYLFSRAGYDAGRIMGGMHGERVSWGTYQDSLCNKGLDEWHCNAHANNLVVIGEGSIAPGEPGHESLLAFLDLDMSFDADTYMDVDTHAVGLHPDLFASLLWREHVNFMEVLAGSDSTSGVPQIAKQTVAQHSVAVKAVKNGLYDTLILSYLSGYSETCAGSTPSAVVPFDKNLHHAAHCLIRLAIIVMSEFIA